MKISIKGPQLPESVSDGLVCAWHKGVGDEVSADELLVEIETDKVVLEVLAPTSGRLLEIKHGEGATIGSAETLAFMEERTVATDIASSAEKASLSNPAQKPEAATAVPDVLMSRAVHQLLREHKIDAHSIKGSGRFGRILKGDVLSHLKHDALNSRPDTVPSSVKESKSKRVPMSRLRQKVAERMLAASQGTASLTTFNEVDMSEVLTLRRRCGKAFELKHGIRLGILSFFVQAVTVALKHFPELNACIEGTDIVYYADCHIGVAVSTDRGLVVPILRTAQDMNLAAIERGVADYAEKARTGTLRIEDMQGGTFTISNGGVFGSMLSTPILNPPQTGILGLHRIQQRPVVIDGAVMARPMMYLALSYDHRLVDGREAVQFLVRVKELVEYPTQLLLDLDVT